ARSTLEGDPEAGSLPTSSKPRSDLYDDLSATIGGRERPGFSRSIEDLAVEGDSLAGGPQWVSSERAPVADQVSPFNRGQEPEILRRAVNDSDRYSPGDGDQTRGSASDRQEDGGNSGQGLGRGGPADGEPGNEFHGPLYGERVRFPGVVVKLVAYVKR